MPTLKPRQVPGAGGEAPVRTCRRIGVSFLMLHENDHLEHHLFPSAASPLHNVVWKELPHAINARTFTGFMRGFLRAALHNDMRPLGVVTPHPSSDTNAEA